MLVCTFSPVRDEHYLTAPRSSIHIANSYLLIEEAHAHIDINSRVVETVNKFEVNVFIRTKGEGGYRMSHF
jgi:hypothetical protein